MKKFEILDEAVDDLDGSAKWYEEQWVGLGLELVAEFRRRLDFALEDPQLGSPAGETSGGIPIRRFRLKQFRCYVILIATINGMPTVLAFEHSSWRPGNWRKRMK